MRRIWRKGLPLVAGLALAAPAHASDPAAVNVGNPIGGMQNEEDAYSEPESDSFEASGTKKKTTKKPAAKKHTTKKKATKKSAK